MPEEMKQRFLVKAMIWVLRSVNWNGWTTNHALVMRTITLDAGCSNMKKHNTFPGEQPEMPVPGKQPEIERPNDPREPEIPEEDPQREPEELPPGANPPEEPPLNPGSIS